MQLSAIADRHYRPGDGSRKAPSYLAEYERLFRPFRLAPLHILELGVQTGASLMIWRDYFPNATIVGVDIVDPTLDLSGKRLHFVRGSQDDSHTLEKAAALAGGEFDIVIDDASHVGHLTRRSFLRLFPMLTPGGLYIIEDYCTSFLPEFPDGAEFIEPVLEADGPESIYFESHRNGMIGVIKQLMDVMNQGLATGSPSSLNIERITVLTNIAVIRKAS